MFVCTCNSNIVLDLRDQLVEERCRLSHLLAQASSKTVHQPDAAGRLRCLLLNLPAAHDAIIKASGYNIYGNNNSGSIIYGNSDSVSHIYGNSDSVSHTYGNSD